MSDEAEDLAQILGEAAQEPKVKSLIGRLNDADVEVLKQWTDETHAKRQEPLKAKERENHEYRHKVSTMSNNDFDNEWAKVK